MFTVPYSIGDVLGRVEKSIEIIEFEVVESHENMRITYYVKESNMNMDISAILEPVDEETRMTCVMDMELRSFLMKVVGRLFQGMGENEKPSGEIMRRAFELLYSILFSVRYV